jgi:hypothetical protein
MVPQAPFGVFQLLKGLLEKLLGVENSALILNGARKRTANLSEAAGCVGSMC